MNDTKDTTTIVAGGEQSPELSAEEKMIQDGFNELLAAYLKSNHRRKVERITKAFNFANQAHAGVKRRSGEPYITSSRVHTMNPGESESPGTAAIRATGRST